MIFYQSLLPSYEIECKAMMTQQHHNDQQKNIDEMRKAIEDFCNAARKIMTDYQNYAINACFEEI